MHMVFSGTTTKQYQQHTSTNLIKGATGKWGGGADSWNNTKQKRKKQHRRDRKNRNQW